MDFSHIENVEYREVLSVILDLNLYWWSYKTHNFELTSFINSITTFSRMYINLTPQNYLAIIGVTNDRSEYLYTTDSLNTIDRKMTKVSKSNDSHIITDSLNRNCFLMEQEIRENIYKMIQPKENVLAMSTNLSGGLIKSLCFYKRKQTDYMEKYKTKDLIAGRFLVIRTPVEENSATFTTMMNGIFGIQKLNICIDVVLLKNSTSSPTFYRKEIPSKSDLSHSSNQSDQSSNNNAVGGGSNSNSTNPNSTNNNSINSKDNNIKIVSGLSGGGNQYHFSPINQAADLTGGTFCEVKLQAELTQYLVSLYLPCMNLRQTSLLAYEKTSLMSKINESWDYNGICLCHGTHIQVGFVCSLCLAVFCQYSVYCLRCQSALTFDKATTSSVKEALVSSNNDVQAKN